ncbi:MAG: hypothetical protein NTW82_04875 [Bacteroidia bacterium]|nr:hypothetical protein [Bacteroidia bacterium]
MRFKFLLILFFLLISCVKEEFHKDKFDASLNLTPGLAIPVGYSHLEIEKYLRDSSITELHISEDGFMTLFYSSDVFSDSMGNFLSFSPVSISTFSLNNSGATIDLQISGSSADLFDTILIPVTLDQSVVRIDSILLLGGSLNMDLNQTGLNGTITFGFPGVQRQGTPYMITRNIADPDFTQDLAGYSIIPEQNATGNHFLRCVLSIHLQSPSGPVNNGSVIFSVQTDISSISIETLYGDFSGLIIDIPPFHLSPQIFNEFIDGHCYFADPEIKVIINNSCGIPVGISFSQFEVTDNDGNQISVTGDGVPTITDPKIIRYPLLNEEGLTISDSLVLNRSNSNITDVLAVNPTNVDITTKAGIVSSANAVSTFIRYDSEVDITASLKLPLYGKAEFLVLLDTIIFDYLSTTLPVPEEIERLIVQVNITNSFPVTLLPQVYLLDENRVLLDSLFNGTEKIEGASDTNGDGEADPHLQDPIYIDLPRKKIDALSVTHYLITKGELTTTGYPSTDVKFYSTSYLDYIIGLIAQLQINTGGR